MDLIVKITERCNFACTFCSSNNIGKKEISIEEVIELLKDYDNKFDTIIFNGGDPLMVKPGEYQQLLDYIDEYDLDINISFTTNLWAFFWHPQEWTPIFKHPKVGVITSFQYNNTDGHGRYIAENTPYTAALFWQVSNMFLKHIGYRPDFISVVDVTNAHFAIMNVELAKEMDVECKLNYANASGRQTVPYPIGMMAFKYYEVYEAGLEEYEYNTKQFLKVLSGERTTCPILPNCDSHIRCLQPNGYYTCGAFGDDNIFGIRRDDDVKKRQTPLRDSEPLACLKEECLSCEAYKLCNGCRKHVEDLRGWYLKDIKSNMIGRNCSAMKSIIKKFKEEMHARRNREITIREQTAS